MIMSLWSHETHGIGGFPIESEACYLRRITHPHSDMVETAQPKPQNVIPTFVDDEGRGVMTNSDNWPELDKVENKTGAVSVIIRDIRQNEDSVS